MKAWRLDAGLTQRSLAERLKRPYSYVYKVESQNRRIDPIELARWVKACKVKPMEVLEVMGIR